MHINLSQELEQYLQSKVKSGFYSNASEVIRAAILRMCEEENKISSLRTAVTIGDEQLDKGEGIPYTQERLDAITANAFANKLQGKKINSDVTS